MNKQIARALVLKNFTEAKGLIFGSLYAKSSLAMDEARYEITKSMFNTPEESDELQTTDAVDSVKEGTGYFDEEVKSGKQRSGRPYPETKFLGWKVGMNMQTKRTRGIAEATDKLTNQ